MSKDNAINISVIIPCYNVENKISKCIRSLEEITLLQDDYEIIFVDDCSSDDTVRIIHAAIKKHNNWFLHVLKENSGSPSKPRNTGISAAKGEYVFFLDSDDEILHSALEKQYTLAIQEDACIVRGYLIVEENGKKAAVNRLEDFPHDSDNKTKIKEIISRQSTTAPSLIKKQLLTDNDIHWEENIRLGEDTLFLIDVFNSATHISYIDEPLFIYHKTLQEEASSTQTYGARELKNHLYVWSEAEKRLAKFGISYFNIRGQVALQTTFQGIFNYYQNDIKEDLFKQFSIFINQHWKTAEKFVLKPRFKQALHHLQQNNYNGLLQTLKPHTVIASDDLFDYLKSAIPADHCKQVNSFELIRTCIKKGMNPTKVLDFGCINGDTSGFFHSVLPDSQWFGLDISNATSKENTQSITINKTIYEGTTFPYTKNCFDLIYSHQALEQIPEPDLVLSEIARILSKDGLFIGQTSQFEPYHSNNYWNFTIYGFKRLIESAGMKLIELRPSIDSFSLIKRSYTSDFDKYNKYFRVESPINIDIEQVAQEKQQSNTTINYRKLMYCGQFCFICTLKK